MPLTTPRTRVHSRASPRLPRGTKKALVSTLGWSRVSHTDRASAGSWTKTSSTPVASGGNRVFLPLVDWFGDEVVAQLFSEESLVDAWLEVERALASAQAELGVIPPEAAVVIEAVAVPEHVDLVQLRSRTLTVGYPICPCSSRSANAPPRPPASSTGEPPRRTSWIPASRSSEGVRSIESTRSRTHSARSSRPRPRTHRATVMPGRTHAQPAVPITFGGKLAVLLAELTRHRERLRVARARLAVVQLFGAAGTAAALGSQSRAVRHRMAERLGLGVVDVPWHTARDSVAEVCLVLASDGGDLRQAGARGDRALPPGDRGGARGEWSPPGCVLDDAAEGQPSRQRGRRRP